jgi:hypothetical protein
MEEAEAHLPVVRAEHHGQHVRLLPLTPGG